MINYIIINGTNSNTINGLGINELPPISKPPLRVQTEEIDGRDGDISTNLGYGAYDKTISIGLFGTGYDINEVISFFNGEGTVVFSNEPNKYYKYKIINQIDYEALLKFKSATITFHCQPFKYPLTETPLEIEYEYIEQEGVESATMNNTNGDSHLDITLKGNTSQYSTTGKNIVDTSQQTFSFNASSTYYQYLTKLITAPNTYQPVHLIAGTTYYISYTVDNDTTGNTRSTPRLYLNASNYYQQTSTNRNLTKGRKVETYTPTTTGDYDCQYWMQGSNENVSISDFMISTSNDTTYEPYTGNQPSPSPSYPYPINVVSGDNTIKVEGKNLFDKNNSSLISKQIDTKTRYGYKLPKANANFYFSKLIDDGKIYSIMEDINGTLTQITNLSTTPTQITNSNNDFYLLCFSTSSQNVAQEYYSNNNFMMAYTNDTYQPYQSQTYPINLGTLELCKIGDYQDYFTKNSDGEWCKYNAIGKEVITNDTSISTYTYDSSHYGFQFTPSPIGITKIDLVHCISNYYIGVPNNQPYWVYDYSCMVRGNGNIAIFDIRSISVNDYKTWAVSNNLCFYYQLATPYLSLIEDETLKSQLDNIQNAMSYDGTTNIGQVNNDRPFLLDLIAMEKGTDEVVINNIGNVYAKPTIALEGTGETDIYLNNTEILKVDLSEKNKITIDTNNMEAYDPTDNSLANRKVIGNYNSMTLPSGNTTMKITGELTKATITDYTRYL